MTYQFQYSSKFMIYTFKVLYYQASDSAINSYLLTKASMRFFICILKMLFATLLIAKNFVLTP